MIVPIVPPIQEIEEIHDASVIEILPDGNGVSSDVRIGTCGPDQPDESPYVNVDKFTIHEMKKLKIKQNSKKCWQYILFNFLSLFFYVTSL